ncbi:MAG: pseudaminic acid synthase [Candidatus Omnitrophica bacterium]|jgi:pseudaminic acid synthase|nr:pseudaminic acid synthase [Candidatus Omnitrophota bacterium]
MINLKKLKDTFIIAEVSANHGQNFKRAVSLIRKAKECGVDAVKFQCYNPDTLTINCSNKYFQIHHPKWGGQTLYQLYKKAYTPWNWFKKLKKVSDDIGIIFFATAFDKTSVDFLEELAVPIHKISSFELVDLPLIEHMAKTKKLLILSTGMANLKEIKEAVSAAKSAGAKDIALLKCISSYPARYQEMNLKTIPDMAKKFKLAVGLSDHTLGITTSIAAVCLGARIIEKHFTLSRKVKTADSFFSIEPPELKSLVENIRIAEKSLGKIAYGLTNDEKISKVFRRSLFVVKDIKKGELFTEDNIKSIRPSNGIKLKYLREIIGKAAAKDIKKAVPLSWNLIKKR